MKSLIISVLTVTLLALSTLSFPAVASDGKLGTVNVSRVLAALPEYEEIGNILEQEFAEPIQRIQELEQEFEALTERLQRDQATMTAEEVEAAQQEWQARRVGLQRSGEQLNQFIQMRESEERNRLLQKIFDELDAFAEANGYDFIFDQSRVPYARDALDVTDVIIERLLN